jgi:hypothetical protein
MASARSDAVRRQYRALGIAQSERVARQARGVVEDEWDEDDIGGSADRVVRRLVPTLTAEQRVAQGLARGFVRSTSVADLGRAVDPLAPLPEVAGTTRGGMTLAEGMAAIGPMVLSSVGKGATVEAAREYLAFAVERFGTNEVIGAGDREQEHQQTRQEIIGWEGIVSSDACDPCQDNAGVHDPDEEMYRHGNCTCTRVPVWGTG